MPKNKVLLIAFFLLLLLGVLTWRFWPAPPASVTQSESTSQRLFSQLKIGEQSFEVVLSQTSSEITQGLSDRQTIGAQGMLFILPEKQVVTFWMYHMRFPLDFIWIAEGKVVDLHENVQAVPFNTPDREIPVVTPAVAAEMVLEVPAGFIQEKGITREMSADLAKTSTPRGW